MLLLFPQMLLLPLPALSFPTPLCRPPRQLLQVGGRLPH
jgi:hypothetical protein